MKLEVAYHSKMLVYRQKTLRCSAVTHNTTICIVKGSDNGVLQSGLLSFWTLSIIWYPKKIVLKIRSLSSDVGIVGGGRTYSIGSIRKS